MKMHSALDIPRVINNTENALTSCDLYVRDNSIYFAKAELSRILPFPEMHPYLEHWNVSISSYLVT